MSCLPKTNWKRHCFKEEKDEKDVRQNYTTSQMPININISIWRKREFKNISLAQNTNWHVRIPGPYHFFHKSYKERQDVIKYKKKKKISHLPLNKSNMVFEMKTTRHVTKLMKKVSLGPQQYIKNMSKSDSQA